MSSPPTDTHKRRERLRDIAAFALILAFALALCAPVLTGRVPVASDTLSLWAPWSRLPHEPVHNAVLADSSLHYMSWLAFSRGAIADGEWPLWDPYAFAGSPYVANSQNQLYYPLTWLRWLLPFSLAIQVLPIFNICIAGWGMYVLSRWLRVSRPGSLVAALAFAGSGMMQLSIEATWVSSVYCWLPFMLYGADRALQSTGWTWTAVAAIPCGLQLVAGNLQWALYSFFAIGCWTLWRAGEHWRAAGWRASVRTLAKGGLLLAGGIALAAIHLVPFAELIGQTTRGAGIASSNSAPISYLLRMVMPEYFNTAAPGVGQPMVFNDLWTVGILPLLLAAIALIKRPRPYVWFWAAMGLFAVLVTFGVGPFLYVRWIPGLHALLPSRIMYLLIFSVALLAGLGYDVWMRLLTDSKESRRGGSRTALPQNEAVETGAVREPPLRVGAPRERQHAARRVLLIVGGTLGIIMAWAWIAQVGEPNVALGDLKSAQLSRGLLLSVLSVFVLAVPLIIRVWRIPKRASIKAASAVLAMGVLALDLLSMVPNYNTFTKPEELVPSAPSIDWLKAQPEPGRVMGVDSGEIVFNPNTQSLYGFGSVNGYDSFHWRRYEEYWSVVDPSVRPVGRSNLYSNLFIRPQAYTSTLASLLNVRYVAATSELVVPPDWTRVYSDEVLIYENPTALPHAFVVGRATILPASEVRDSLAVPGFDPSNELLLEQEETPPSLSYTNGRRVGTAQISSYKRNSVTVEVEVTEPSWLVLSDPNYPGWSASVDGQEQKVYTAYYLLRAVPLQAGRHTVVFTYWPTGYWPAIIVSLMAVVVIVGVVAAAVVRRYWQRLWSKVIFKPVGIAPLALQAYWVNRSPVPFCTPTVAEKPCLVLP